MDSKLIVTIIIGVIFVVSFIFSMVNAGRLLGEGIKEIMGYDNCDYARPRMIDPESNKTIETYEDNYCVNDKKRSISESLAYLIISLPITIIFYKRLMKLRK